MNVLHIALFVLVLCTSLEWADASTARPLKILHLSFHRGCIQEFDNIAAKLGLSVDSWWIQELPPGFFDGVSVGNALYNVGHDRAERIWQLHHDTFEQYDLILTSDTCPLARIFLQNGWQKPLVIWICNRFDYCDLASLDCDFPDDEYYELMKSAAHKSNVRLVGYTAFEHYYAKSKGVDTGSLVITPCGVGEKKADSASLIPAQVNKGETFFLPPYHNETHYMDLSAFLTNLGICNYRGRYAGPGDLMDFKAIIHLPYSWSNLAFFENMNAGIPYLVPSRDFFCKLALFGNYFHPNLNALLEENLFGLSEWYSEDHAPILTYFDSWEHLADIVNTIDYTRLRSLIKAHAADHQQEMLTRWSLLFNSFAEEPDSHRR